jgi:hypothetical protein
VTVSAAGIATGVAEKPATITAFLGTVSGSAAFSGTPSKFRLTGSLNTPRTNLTATVLQNGQVLIVGGNGGNSSSGYSGVTELYNPATGNFTLTGSLNVPRWGHTATLLQNGQVLIVGGNAYSNGNYFKTNQAELYDPTSGSFSYANGNLNLARTSHTATLLQNGTVLFVGGQTNSGATGTAELYDPSSGTFSYTASVSTTLLFHSATLLNDGAVLIAGGDSVYGQSPLATAQIYNPTTGTFTTTTGNLMAPRENHIASLLANGNVLIATGNNTQGYLATAELYNPTSKTFSLIGTMAYAREYATANLLNSGQVLIAGGWDQNSLPVPPAELYDPVTSTFSLAGNFNIPRSSGASALLNDGTVLIAGGSDQYYYQGAWFGEYVPQGEIYQTTGKPVAPDSLQITPVSANIVVGGTKSFTAVDSNGYPRQDVIWTVSDPGLASVMADENERGVVLGIAVGQITVTATVGNVSGQAQVTISSGTVLAPGTTIWSAPAIPGYSAIQLVQAVPSADGPDLYSIQLSTDGTKSIVQALRADGQQLWQTTLPPLNNNSVPDGAGGLWVTEYNTCTPGQANPMTVVDLDPVYGQPTSAVAAAGVRLGNNVVYCYNGGAPQIAVRGDGATFITEPTNNGFPQLTKVETGNYIGFSIPPSSDTENGSQIDIQCCMGPPMVNTDGTTYVEYEVRNIVNQVITSDSLNLWWQPVGGGAGSSTLLASTTQDQALLPGSIIPDGNGDVIATWTISPSNPPAPQYPYQAVDISAGVVGTPYNLPFSPSKVTFGESPTLVLGESGVAFASGQTTAADGVAQVSQIASFALSSGTSNWTYQAPPWYKLSLVAATTGNGLVARTTDASGADSVIRFDPSSPGIPTVDAWTSAGYKQVTFFASDAFFATSVTSGQRQLVASGQEINWALYSPWAQPEPDNRPDPKITVALSVSNIYESAAQDIWTNSAIAEQVNSARDFWWEKAKILLNWDGTTITAVKGCDPVLYRNGCGANPQLDITSITSQATANEFGRRFCQSGVLFTCRPKGSQLVFLSGIFLWGGLSGTVDGLTPNTPDTSNLLNISAIASIEKPNDIAHELGHQFELQHEPWVGPSNLMCASVWCPRYPGSDLNADQVVTARKNAALLQ